MSILSSLLGDLWSEAGHSARRRSLKRYAKLHAFMQARLKEDLYPERPDPRHTRVTHDALERINQRWGLQGKHVLDVGCGRGIALEKLTEYGARAKGLTFGADYEECKRRGFDVFQMDMSFLEFPDETFDLIWARHSLEHSLFPYFTLHVLFSALKHGGLLYARCLRRIRVPSTSPTPTTIHALHTALGKACSRGSVPKLVEAFDIEMQLVCGPDTWYSFYLQRP